MAGPKSMAPDLAQPEKETWAHLLAGPPPTGGGVGSQVHCVPGGGQERRPWMTDPQLPRLAIGTWNVASLLGKEPE